MIPLPLIDSHVHLWNPARLGYAWLEGIPPLNRSFLPADYQAACASLSVEKFVFVECGCAAAQNLSEVNWATELARTEPRLQGIIAQVSLERGAAVRAELTTLAANPLVKGVRRILQGESDPEFCLRSDFVAGVRSLAEFGYSFDLCVAHPQLPTVTRLVERCPEISFILDHCGKPAIREQRLDPWRQDLRALASLPNVCCKLSGLVTEADHLRWQPEELKPFVAHVIECFGCDRLLFGSDWPVATLATDFPRWVSTLHGLLVGAGEVDLAKVFHHNAARIYRV